MTMHPLSVPTVRPAVSAILLGLAVSVAAVDASEFRSIDGSGRH